VAAEVVWGAVVDWEGQREWIPGTRVGVVAGDGRSVGSRLFGFTGIADVGFLDVLEIVEWQPPRVCRMRHLGTLLRGEGVFEIEPLGDDRSAFVWTERLESPIGWVGRVGMAALRPVAQAVMRRAAVRLSRQVSGREALR
jgi:Polyketide cyclase / dehydrase and lipid transport